MVIEREKVKMPGIIVSALPSEVILDIERTSRSRHSELEEIRLRTFRKNEYVFSEGGVLGEAVIDYHEMEEIFFKLCGGSVYVHEESIRAGFIRAEGGVRIGVAGRAVVKDGKISAVHPITSLNIRLPCKRLLDVGEIADRILCCEGGLLIFSPPGVGKTTYLRSLAAFLSTEKGKRVVVIDSSGELSFSLEGKESRIDILDGYPRAEGIEIGIRFMNPDFIICDEIGNIRDAQAILAARDCGVRIIASAHGERAEEIIRRIGIAELHEAGIFSNYLKLTRASGQKKRKWIFIDRDEIGGLRGDV